MTFDNAYFHLLFWMCNWTIWWSCVKVWNHLGTFSVSCTPLSNITYMSDNRSRSVNISSHHLETINISEVSNFKEFVPLSEFSNFVMKCLIHLQTTLNLNMFFLEVRNFIAFIQWKYLSHEFQTKSFPKNPISIEYSISTTYQCIDIL